MLALTTWSLLGCNRYVPVTAATPAAPNGHVRIVLGAKGTLAVEPALGPNVRSIEASVVRTVGDTLFLRVEETTSLTGARTVETPGKPVSIARGDALSIDAQRVDTRRSILLVAAVAVGVFVFTSLIQLGDPGSIDEGSGPAPLTRIPR